MKKQISISKKRESKLYGDVHEEIMKARIKIAQLLTYCKDGDEVDDILSNLCQNAPQKAIDMFKIKNRV